MPAPATQTNVLDLAAETGITPIGGGLTGFAFDTRQPEARAAMRSIMAHLSAPARAAKIKPAPLTADERADLYRRFPNAEALADLDARLAKGAF